MQVFLSFNQGDDGLNFEASMIAKQEFSTTELSIAGAASWRHLPSNIVALSKDFLDRLESNGNTEFARNLAKQGMNYIGVKSRYNILVPASVRSGKNGTKKTTEFLRLFTFAQANVRTTQSFQNLVG